MKPPPEDADSLDKNGDDTRRDRFIGDRDLTTWRSRLGRQLARVTQWLGPYATLTTTLVIGMVAVVALTAIAAEIYEAVTESDGVAGLDKPLLAAAISIRTPWLDTAATALTDVAGVIGMPIIAVLAIIILTIRRRSWTPALLITAAGIGSLLMTIAGKNLIGRARPDLTDAVPPYEHSPSFPSGHALNAVVIAGIIAYLLILRPTTPDRQDHHDHHRRDLCCRNRGDPGVPRAPLVHRRPRGLLPRSRVARPRHHRAPPVLDSPPQEVAHC